MRRIVVVVVLAAMLLPLGGCIFVATDRDIILEKDRRHDRDDRGGRDGRH